MTTYWNIKIVDNQTGNTSFEGYLTVTNNVVTDAKNYNTSRVDGKFPDSQSNIDKWTDCLKPTDYYSSNSNNTAGASSWGFAGFPVNNSFITGASTPGPQFDATNNNTTQIPNQESGAFGLSLNGFILDLSNSASGNTINNTAVRDQIALSDTDIANDISNGNSEAADWTGYGDLDVFQILPVPDLFDPSGNTAAFSFQSPYSNKMYQSNHYYQLLLQTSAFPTPSDYNINVELTLLSQDPSCFLENTAILCFQKTLGQERYLPIQTLRVGDLVKTYKHGYRAIQHIGKSYMFNDPHLWYSQLYILKKTEDNGLLEDVIMTGGHGIMVDKYTNDILKPHARNFVGNHPIEKIDDKSIVLAAEHKDTVGLSDTNFYTIYHLVLDNDGDKDKRFCIWADGMLSETPSETQYKSHGYIDLDDEHYYYIENGKPEEKEKADKERAMITFKMRIRSSLDIHIQNERRLEKEAREKIEQLKTSKKRTQGYTRKITPILDMFSELEKELNTK